MRIVIATTAPSSFAEVISIDALNQMRNDVLGKTLYHWGKLWVVTEAETVPTVDVHADFDRDVIYSLIADLVPMDKVNDAVEAECDYCPHASSLAPERAKLCEVPLDVCLKDDAFVKALARLMRDRGIGFFQGAVTPTD